MLRKTALMCATALAILGLGLEATPSQDVVSLEKQTWELWQMHDKAGYTALMDNDFVAVDTHGVAVREQNVADIDNLVKESYDLSDFQVHRIAADVVFLT